MRTSSPLRTGMERVCKSTAGQKSAFCHSITSTRQGRKVRYYRATHAVLRAELLVERGRHDGASDARRGIEVRLARLAGGGGDVCRDRIRRGRFPSQPSDLHFLTSILSPNVPLLNFILTVLMWICRRWSARKPFLSPGSSLFQIQARKAAALQSRARQSAAAWEVRAGHPYPMDVLLCLA